MQTVLSLLGNDLKNCESYYQPYQTGSLPTGSIFQAKKNGVTITAYKSGKVMFQGANVEQESSRWQKVAQQPSSMKKAQSKNTYSVSQKTKPGESLPAGFSNWSVIGSDEVGAGAYFGPMTSAAVYVNKESVAWVKKLGIMDSKQLTDDKIKQLASLIKGKLPFKIVNLSPEKYNHLHEEGTNIVAMKALSHNFALSTVEKMIQPVQPDAILIDQFVSGTTYFRYLKQNHQDILNKNVYFSTKGESFHVAVAAASIVARDAELIEMEKLSVEAGFTLPIGSGKEADQAAAKLLREGKDLRHFVKLHFANTEKAKQLLTR